MAESHRVPRKPHRNEDKEDGIFQKCTNPDWCSDNNLPSIAKKHSDTMTTSNERPQIMSTGGAEVKTQLITLRRWITATKPIQKHVSHPADVWFTPLRSSLGRCKTMHELCFLAAQNTSIVKPENTRGSRVVAAMHTRVLRGRCRLL